jgi:hypothetical protein
MLRRISATKPNFERLFSIRSVAGATRDNGDPATRRQKHRLGLTP